VCRGEVLALVDQDVVGDELLAFPPIRSRWTGGDGGGPAKSMVPSILARAR
jgi:hypothetical protein